jgi:hypothetical protein
MANFRTIEIDIDVHKRIELERRSFDEPPNAALRRLLEIDTGPAKPSDPSVVSAGRTWSWKGVSLPHGTELRMEYNGRVHTGIIEDGRWRVEGSEYGSPSAAAGGVARTKDGKRTSLDGWIYWQVKRPGDTDWIGISALRRP